MNIIVNGIINLVNWFSWFVALVSVFMGLYSGFLYMISKDNPEKTRQAFKAFVFTIIGVVTAVASFGLVSFLQLAVL